jgi:hypothetical protein
MDVLKNSWDQRRLLPHFLAALLNFPQFKAPPDALVKRFAQLKDRSRKAAWADLQHFHGLRKIIELIPKASQRTLFGFGDIFLLFSSIFETARHICNYYGASDIDRENVLKLVAFNCEFDHLLTVYILYNAIVFQRGPLTSLLKKNLVHDWSAFLRMILRTMQVDEKLCEGVAAFSPV